MLLCGAHFGGQALFIRKLGLFGSQPGLQGMPAPAFPPSAGPGSLALVTWAWGLSLGPGCCSGFCSPVSFSCAGAAHHKVQLAAYPEKTCLPQLAAHSPGQVLELEGSGIQTPEPWL